LRDPHVVALQYRLETEPNLTFENPPPVDDERDAFHLRLENGFAVFQLNHHFSKVEDARGAVDPYLRAWEIDAALASGQPEIRFIFGHADVVDRNPPPPGSYGVVAVEDVVAISAVGSVTVRVGRKQYPPPPRQFQVSPDVETLWQRYEGYLRGKEPLPAMAYFCLTMIEALAGRRKKAAKWLHISRTVLKMLGNLTSTRGDEKMARKVEKGRPLTPMSDREKAWIEAAIKPAFDSGRGNSG
jgi:hypothetical protein